MAYDLLTYRPMGRYQRSKQTQSNFPVAKLYTSFPVCSTCVTYLLIFYLLFSLIALRSQNRRMDSSWVRYYELGRGYGVILLSRDWILRLRGDGEIAPNFAKNLTVPLFSDLS